MSTPTTCPTCGAALPGDAPRGACPTCLLEAGFATGGAAEVAAGDPEIDRLAPLFPGLVIQAPLGRGGMGAVYRARHVGLDRLVALKVLTARVEDDPALADRFRREARALAMLQHPNIVAVHDFGVTDGLAWIVMEYVDGTNVRHAMRAGAIGPDDALAIVPQICDALQYAHEHGVVHRDIKPENVLLDRSGRVKVADFGLAKLTATATFGHAPTEPGRVMGTPHYMSPEQVEHPADVDHRSDIYSLGVVFYEMLTGELPLGRFAPPSERGDVDARIDAIVFRTLEKERGARYQHAADVRTAVGVVTGAGARSPGAPPEPVTRDRAAQISRRLRILAACHLANGALVLGVGLWKSLQMLGIRGDLTLDPNAPLAPDEAEAVAAVLRLADIAGWVSLGAGTLLAAASWTAAYALYRRRFPVLSVVVAGFGFLTGPQGIVLGIVTMVVVLGRDAESVYRNAERAGPRASRREP